MDNLYKLAKSMLSEAEDIAVRTAHDPGKHLKEIEVAVKLCDFHRGICESLIVDEKLDGKAEGMSNLFSDNPGRHRR